MNRLCGSGRGTKVTNKRLRTAVLVATALAVLAIAPGTMAAPAPDGIDCTGPAGDPSPGTPAWHEREAKEAQCGEQRARDTAANPAFHAAGVEATARNGAIIAQDPFRDPAKLTGTRFRYEKVTFVDPKGQPLAGRLFLPCDSSCHGLPAGLRAHAAPHPGVVVVHGGAADQEMYWWGVEPLAEAGYMVLTFQVPRQENTGPGSHYADTKAALDFLTSTPASPTGAGEVNPHWADLDRGRIGLAGHSAGGMAVSRLGQEDERVSAIVSWDRAQSSPMPPDLRLRTPALFMTADYNCQQVPVCVPQPYTSPPDPLGPGNKDEDFRRLRAAGLDTMKVALRAATHLDFTQFGLAGTGSRYGAAVSSYYTLAWFDRYLAPDPASCPRPHSRDGRRCVSARRAAAADGLRRLTATTFDDSADVHNISGGVFDPETRQNVPAMIGGQSVRDRLSFHFRSGYFLGGGTRRCEDVRAGCG
ncbi:MAG: alpha/beta hydrolase [Thermoleophilaceae bacterium]